MEMQIKIAIIGTAGIPALYGGFETLAENLVKNRLENIEYTVFCSEKLYPKRERNYFGSRLWYIGLNPNGIGSIIYDLVCMLLSLRSDVMLILGVSGSIFLPLICLLYNGKIITNIDGIEWRRNKWNRIAKLILRVSERLSVRFSSEVICDNQGIIEYVFKTYKKKAVLIEYGADHTSGGREKIENTTFCDEQYAITVCRIEPENNIHCILDAFVRQNKISLVIVGNWKSNNYGRSLLKKYGVYTSVHLLDPIYDVDRINFLRSSAFLYVHGHSAGGTNPSLVEAMFLGLPVLAFDCVFNRFTTENQCLYWSSVDELYAHIDCYDNSKLSTIGINMKQIAERRYMWKTIVSKYEALFYSTC